MAATAPIPNSLVDTIARAIADDRLEEAFALIERGLGEFPDNSHLLERHGQLAQSLHLLRSVYDHEVLFARSFPERVEHHRNLIAHLTSRELWDETMEYVRIAREKIGPAWWLTLAEAEAAVGKRSPDARTVIERALATATTSEGRLAAVELFLQLGELDRARLAVDQLVDHDPNDVTARVMQATLAVWSGEIGRARQLVKSIPAGSPGLARTQAALSLAFRNWPQAEQFASQALTEAPEDVESKLLLSEALRLLGKPDQARDAAMSVRQSRNSWKFPLAGILSALHIAKLDADAEWKETAAHVQLALNDFNPRNATESPPQLAREWLKKIGHGIGWNFSAAPTRLNRAWWRRPRWEPLSIPMDSRTASVRTFDLIDTLPAEDLCGRFDTLMKTYPDSPFPYTHRAELHLWFGNYADAEADARESLAIDPDAARFGAVALGGALAWQGRTEEAIKVLDQQASRLGDFTSTVLLAYRGEVHWLRGSIGAAKSDLRTAITSRPTRVSSHLILGLIAHAEVDSAAVMDLHRRFCAAMPDLVRSARHDLHGQTRTMETTPDEAANLLRHVLKMMRGNRSSNRVTWFPSDGRPRIIQAEAM